MLTRQLTHSSVKAAHNRDIVARGRAPGIIPVEATQRPSADIVPTSLRDLFGYRWAFRCSTEASSDTILGHGWADKGYCATEIDPQARGVGWLRAEDGIPKRVKAAFLTDGQIIDLADHAAQLRRQDRAHRDQTGEGQVVKLVRKGDGVA
jgi:DNA segregation ATPase FtsK/SpoIIIE, S-DNA-T family